MFVFSTENCNHLSGSSLVCLCVGETDAEVRLGALRLAQSLVLDEGNFGVVQELNEVVRDTVLS